MRVDQPQELRKSRLRELLDHQDFDGNKAELGRALGYKNGSHVYQMLDGRRPITEKLVEEIETMRGGKYRGWFAVETKGSTVEPWPLDPFISRERWMAMLPEHRAAAAWEASKVVASMEATAPPKSEPGKRQANGK